MSVRIAVAVLAAAAAPTAVPTAAAAKSAKAPVARDWSTVVVATPQGGFRMGNPAAPVKLVEYGSLACPHCRHFEETGYRPLVQQYVRRGRVSYEFRNYLLNGADIAASLLARCAGPAKFFPMSQAIFRTQPQWFAKVAAISSEQKAAMEQMTDQERIARMGAIAGFSEIAGRFGVSTAKARQCLTDPKALQQLLEMTKTAQDAGVHGTPTFLINGKQADAATWEQLEPLLKAAGG